MLKILLRRSSSWIGLDEYGVLRVDFRVSAAAVRPSFGRPPAPGFGAGCIVCGFWFDGNALIVALV
jgi:hypothetical protein